jgi:hypothetical protein
MISLKKTLGINTMFIAPKVVIPPGNWTALENPAMTSQKRIKCRGDRKIMTLIRSTNNTPREKIWKFNTNIPINKDTNMVTMILKLCLPKINCIISPIF